MSHQGNVQFKLEGTGEMIASRSGLMSFGELVRVLKVKERVEQHFFPAWVQPGLQSLVLYRTAANDDGRGRSSCRGPTGE
jgi:hypothetical protein